MSAVFLTCAVGLTNFCLGYALAVRFGLGPPSVTEAWEAMLAEIPEQGEFESSPSTSVSGRDEQQTSLDESAECLVQELILPPDWKDKPAS